MVVSKLLSTYRDRGIAALVLLVGVALSGAVWFVNPKTTDAQFLVAFAGYPRAIEYNCLCSGSIMVTVEPTPTMRQQGQQQMDLLFVWAADLLSEYMPFDVPTPTAYLWCGVFWQGNQTLMGNYVPGGFPCVQFVGPPDWCRTLRTAQGAILNVGSNLFSTQ